MTTLQERMRVQYNLTAMDEFEEAADALDAQAERIKELEGALRVLLRDVEAVCDDLELQPAIYQALDLLRHK